MKRTVLFIVFLAAGGLALWGQAASVRASGRATTLPTMYHADGEEGAMVVVIHNTPKSPGKDSEQNKDRFAIGDKLVFSAPLYGTKDLNRKGGMPVATFYGEATVLKGDTFANMLTMLHFDFVFATGDHITGQGIVNWTGADQGAAITGGTGAYEGARGTVHNSEVIDNLVITHMDNLVIVH